MRILRWLLILLAALWLVGELAVVPFAESRIEQRVAERNPGVGSVKADIGSFPVATRLVLTGRINKLDVTLDRVVRQRLTFAQVRFELTGIELDRGSILRRETRVSAIDTGRVTATIDGGALASVFGRVINLSDVTVRVRGRVLAIGPASVSIASDLLPCEPQARVEGDSVILTCTFDEVPQAVLEAAQRG
jgi:hypothetical protein